MKRISFSPYFLFAFIFFFWGLAYLTPPSPEFPIAPPDAVQSLEEADTEYIYRRAYFTNLKREEVLKHYQHAFGNVKILGIEIPSYRLSYPPEEAYSIIRDQTRSVYLEEIVHPFRESFYVNGFVPKVEKDDIWYKGVHYDQKITVRYVPSDKNIRIVVFALSLTVLTLIVKQSIDALIKLIKSLI